MAPVPVNDQPSFDSPFCSVLVVNLNGKKHLDRCIRSLEQLDHPADRLEILLIDNGSDDGSDLEATASHRRLRLLRNPVNNFAAALNLGVAQCKGSYVAFVNNDVFLEPQWLKTLVGVLENDPRAGCAGGKILFENGRINSVGHRALPNFYWDDRGYDEEDHGQYDAPREVEGLCWAAVLFRKECLADLHPIDEDFILYYEDVDTSLRCRRRGWKLLYHPAARARHVFHGSSHGNFLADYFIDRARLIFVAKHHPANLARSVENSRFVTGKALDSLYDNLPAVLRKLMQSHPAQAFEKVLEEVCEVLVRLFGSLAVDHLLARMQVILGHRRMSIGFYDQALHVIGGGQRYGCAMASALKDRYEVTLVANKPVAVTDLESWYGLSLSGCQTRELPMPYFDRIGAWIDSNVVTSDAANPFEIVSSASKTFDIFVNVNMLTMVRPLSPFSVFLCHFPDSLRRCYFSVDDYSCLVVNSQYTAQWVKNLWGLDAQALLYPPVKMGAQDVGKENLILSVARFEPGGSKKQLEMIRAFELLCDSHPRELQGWRLALAGGSLPRNHCLAEVERRVRESSAPISIHVNVPLTELESLYARAAIFWHACGLDESNPHLVEHFGMSIVEGMQNSCVPIVFNGGGQTEIVEHGRSGLRFNTLSELCAYTLRVITTPELMDQLRQGALERSKAFTQEGFMDFVKKFFAALEDEYRTVPMPDPRDILRGHPRENLFHSPAARRWNSPLPQD